MGLIGHKMEMINSDHRKYQSFKNTSNNSTFKYIYTSVWRKPFGGGPFRSQILRLISQSNRTNGVVTWRVKTVTEIMYMVFSLEAHRFTYIPRGSVLLNTCSYIDRGISFAFAFRFVLRNHLHHFVFDSIRKRTLKKKEIGEALKKKRKNWRTRKALKKKRKRGH